MKTIERDNLNDSMLTIANAALAFYQTGAFADWDYWYGVSISAHFNALA